MQHFVSQGKRFKINLNNVMHRYIDKLSEALGTTAEIMELNLNMYGGFQDDHIDYLVQKLPYVTGLNLEGTKITDAGLSRLINLTQLRSLNCSCCEGITDVGLFSLVQLTQLKRLLMFCTGVSHAGFVAFKEQRPDVVIMK